MSLSLQQAIPLFISLSKRRQATASNTVFTSYENISILIEEMCKLSDATVSENGVVLVNPGISPQKSRQNFLAYSSRNGRNGAKNIDKQLKSVVKREVRYEAIIRAAYRLGFSLDTDGLIVYPKG